MGVIERLLKLLLHYTTLLDKLSVEELKDEYRYYAALHLLQIQIQALIDIVFRATSILGIEAEGYIDADCKLMQAGILNSDELRFYRKVAGFRNIVVHMHIEVNPDIVREVIRGRRYKDVAKLGIKIVEELRRRGADY
jgi:uncharacterized protein YutE (UPF0331/DUF86 family)